MKKGKEDGRLGLIMNAEVKRCMKAYCALIGEDVSERTEQLYIAELKKHGQWPPRNVPKKK